MTPDAVRELVGRVLGLSGPALPFSDEEPLSNHGLDSIKAVALAAQIESAVGRPIPPSQIQPQSFRSVSAIVALSDSLSEQGPGER